MSHHASLSAFFAMLYGAVTGGAPTPQPTRPERFNAVVAEARARVREVDPAGLEALRKSSAPLLLLDIREDGEWARGAIPGSVHLCKGLLEAAIEYLAPQAGTRIVLYGNRDGRAILAADSLQRMGYTDVYALRGGYQFWRRTAGSAEPAGTGKDAVPCEAKAASR